MSGYHVGMPGYTPGSLNGYLGALRVHSLFARVHSWYNLGTLDMHDGNAKVSSVIVVMNSRFTLISPRYVCVLVTLSVLLLTREIYMHTS